MADVIGKLGDEWWKVAKEAAKWKAKFECMGELMELATGDISGNKKPPDTIAENAKVGDLLKILIDWLVNEGHVFTRMHILKLLPTIFRSTPKKVLKKYQQALSETLMVKQWSEKKSGFCGFVGPALLEFWLKSGIELKSEEFKPHLFAALKHRTGAVQMSAFDFLAKATLFPSRKKQLMELMNDKEIIGLIEKGAGHKDKPVREAMGKFMLGITQMGIKKLNKAIPPILNKMQEDKRGKKALDQAKKDLEADRAIFSGQDVADEAPEEEEKPKKGKKGKGKKGKKGKGKKGKKKKGGGGGDGGGDSGGAAPAKATPAVAAGGGGGAAADGDDVKEEDGKKYKLITKTVKKTRPKPGSGAEYKKAPGGLMTPAIERKTVKCKCPKGFSEGMEIDKKKHFEDNKKALEASAKLKALNAAQTFKKLERWTKSEEDTLKKTMKITDRVQALEGVVKDMIGANPEWSNLYDGCVGLAAECMGWEGNDARNPMLVKLNMKLITAAMNGAQKGKKDGGLFTTYLTWALQKLQEKKFNKEATACLMATCYQYSPKVVFSVIEQLILEPEEKRDFFKADKAWGPIMKFAAQAVNEFGVDNFFPLRLLHLCHELTPKARGKDPKDACYALLNNCYTQLGPTWRKVIMGPLGSQQQKKLNKDFDKNTDAGKWQQLRCTMKEKIPEPSGGETEEYEEQIKEWVEIVEEAAAAEPAAAEKKEDAAPAVEEKVKEKTPEPVKEKTPEPKEPTPEPPPPDGPFRSTDKQKANRLKCAKKLKTQWDYKVLDKAMMKEYDLHITPKKANDKKHPGVWNDGCGDYDIKDMDKFKSLFVDRKAQVKKLKPIVASLEAWCGEYFEQFEKSSDVVLFWMNMFFSENPQPNVAKMFMPLWDAIVTGFADFFKIMPDLEGKMICSLLCERGFSMKQVVEQCHEVLAKLEHVLHPAVCLRVYVTLLDKSKSNAVKFNCIRRIKNNLETYGLSLIKTRKTPTKPYKDQKTFCKDFLKIYLKLKDKKAKSEADGVIGFCYRVLGKKGFWSNCKVSGSDKEHVEGLVDGLSELKKGKLLKGDGEWIATLIKRKQKEEAAAKRAEQMGAGGGLGGAMGGGDGDGGGGMLGDTGVPIVPLGPLPGLVAQNFTPLMFTPQQLLALKYGPAPHSWQMNNFRHYVDRLPAAFCMDWEEFEQKKNTVKTQATAPYIKIGDVRIDVETGKQFTELTDGGKVKVFASTGPGNDARAQEEKKFMSDAQKDDEIMQDIMQIEKNNAEYFDEHNDGSSWLALYDVNGFDDTDRQIQLIEMRNIYGVKTLQTWLHCGKNVSIVESSVADLLNVLLPWLRDLINTSTLMNESKRYEHTYQILQLLKFCCQFTTLKSLNPSDLRSWLSTLLTAITYDNISALFGHHHRRILGEINDVLIKSIAQTNPKTTLCILISLLSECEPTNDSLSKQQYAEACCKLIYKVLKKSDSKICQMSDSVRDVYVEIVKFFSAISFETWQMAEPKRRFPLKVIQMIIARIVFFMGNSSAQHLEAAIESIQNNNNNNGVNNLNNDYAYHQRDLYAKRLIMNFIACCENRRLQKSNIKYQYLDDQDEMNKPLNIKQAQSTLQINNNNDGSEHVNRNVNMMKPTDEAPSTLQQVHDLEKKAHIYAQTNKVDLNFALWVGMTGKKRTEYFQ